MSETRIPDLTLVRNAARVLEDEGTEVHAITVEANGQHGGWDVRIEGDEPLGSDPTHFVMDATGSRIERLAVPA